MSPRTLGVALAILAFVLVAGSMTACEQGRGSLTSAAAPGAAVANAPAASGAPAVEQLRSQGDALRERGQYEEALSVYQKALRHEPSDLGLRYGTAVTLSYLNRRDEAVAAFTWVAGNGLPQSEPVRHAETWLREAGALTTIAEPIAAKDRTPTAARLHGRVAWENVDSSQPAPRVHVIIEGTDPSNKGKIYNTAVDLNSDYEFPNVQPGTYRVTAQSRLVRLWDTSVTIREGDPTILILDQASSIAPPNTFLAKQ
jgi:tetratricopeptide (TPR) repeat protein